MRRGVCSEVCDDASLDLFECVERVDVGLDEDRVGVESVL
jgi:hypothetical protein